VGKERKRKAKGWAEEFKAFVGHSRASNEGIGGDRGFRGLIGFIRWAAL